MVVQNQTKLNFRRILNVQDLQETDEFLTAMSVGDHSMDLATDEVDSCQEAYRTVADVLVVSREIGLFPGNRRQIRSGVLDRLDTGFLVVRKNGNHHRGSVVGCLAQHRHLVVDAEHLCHFGLKLRITPFQIVGDLVRADFGFREDLRDCAARNLHQARMSCFLTVVLNMQSQQTRSPPFVGVTQILWLPTGQIHNPGASIRCNGGSLTAARQVFQRGQSAKLKSLLHRPFYLWSIGMQSAGNGGYAISRSIRQKKFRPLDTMSGFRARSAKSSQPVSHFRGQHQRCFPTPERHLSSFLYRLEESYNTKSAVL